MSRSTRASARDAQLRALSDQHILEFLAAAWRGLARTEAGEEAAYRQAIAPLELEAARRGLPVPAPHERTPLVLLLRRLALVEPTDAGEWERLLAELDLPGLWAVYLHAQTLAGQARVAALAYVCVAVDRIVYGRKAAHLRYLKNVELPATLEAQQARLQAALEGTFGALFDAMAREDDEA